jgi:hypothetical protein
MVTVIAVSVSLHLNSIGDLGFRVVLSILLITIIHCAIAYTFHTYFSMIKQETKISLGSDVCSAWNEKRGSGYLFVSFTVLFAVSLYQNNEKDKYADATKG